MSLLNRRDALRALLRERGNLIVVAGLGSSAYDLASCSDEPLDFPLWGAMGGAAMIGLGLALAQPERPVLVVTGDGEMLMGMGSLATIATRQPPNLRLVVLDNERFGETGQQRTHTAMGTDLAAVARACGIAHSLTVREKVELDALREQLHGLQAPLFAVVKVALEELPRVLPPRDGAYLTQRLREALLGTATALEG
jgi:thiamine pyrophosphate-dependent acetolactate synthase large subunit-like protein